MYLSVSWARLLLRIGYVGPSPYTYHPHLDEFTLHFFSSKIRSLNVSDVDDLVSAFDAGNCLVGDEAVSESLHLDEF